MLKKLRKLITGALIVGFFSGYSVPSKGEDSTPGKDIKEGFQKVIGGGAKGVKKLAGKVESKMKKKQKKKKKK